MNRARVRSGALAVLVAAALALSVRAAVAASAEPPAGQENGAPQPVPRAGVEVSAPAPAPPPPPAEPSRPLSDFGAVRMAPRSEMGGDVVERAVPRPAPTDAPRTDPFVRVSVPSTERLAAETGLAEAPQAGRQRGDRPASGRAVPRRGGPVVVDGPLVYRISPYWYGYGYWLPLGYYGAYFYDPFWYGYSPRFSRRAYYAYRADYGHLRLKVRPREAQVYVDGYFAGVVDNFDGLFQRLTLRAGGHRVELRAEGYQPLVFDVLIPPGETVTYRGELERR